MKAICIICIACFCLASCSKTSDNGGTSATDSVIYVVPVPALINNLAFESLMVQGGSWKWLRIDTLSIDMRSKTLYVGNPGGLSWTATRKPDSAFVYLNNVLSNINLIYRDTSTETVTVSGKASFGSLVNMYKAMNTANSGLNYLRDSLHTNDTASLAVWLVKNNLRNTTDTEYVFLSSKYFAILPTGSNATNKEVISFFEPLPVPKGSLIFPQGLVPQVYNVFYSVADSSFTFNNHLYFPASFILDYRYSRSGNGFSSSHNSREIYFTRQEGMLRVDYANTSYEYIFGNTSYSSVRTIIN